VTIIRSKRKPPKHDVWVTEIRTGKPLPPRVLALIRKYEDVEVSEQ